MADEQTNTNAQPTTLAPANKPPIIQLRERLISRRDELALALPDDVTPEHFIRAVTTAAQLNADILACSWQSIWNSCLKACRDGLLPDGHEAALVPYKDAAGYVPMYHGLLNRCYKTGQFKMIGAEVVRSNDEFHYHVDENGKHFRHVPTDEGTGDVTRAYALALTVNGGHFLEVLPLADIHKIRGMSKTRREDAPWVQWFAEMAKKTALRRLCKTLPTVRGLPSDDEPDEPAIEFELPAPQPRAEPKSPAAGLEEFAGAQS